VGAEEGIRANFWVRSSVGEVRSGNGTPTPDCFRFGFEILNRQSITAAMLLREIFEFF
jgi:hypothetical protein